MNMWKLLVILAVIKIKLQGDSRSNELPSISEGLAQYLSGLKVDKVNKIVIFNCVYKKCRNERFRK